MRLTWVASRRFLVGAVAAALVITMAGPLGPAFTTSTAPTASAGEQPNVLLILTDDQRAGSLVAMPTVTREIVDQGTSYPNAFVPTSWCCPSRASLLSGKFAHNSGVWENASSSAWGAWPSFSNGGEESDTIATRLHDAGYRTGLFGKYLNDATAAGEDHVPPGWDKFSAFLGGNYTRYRLTSDGAHQPKASRTYLTDELADQTIDFIKSTPKGEPFFAYFAPFAPHYPYDPGPYAGATDRAGLLDELHASTNYPSPSTNQADMSPYPRWMQKLPVTDTWEEKGRANPLDFTIDEVVERQADTLMGVDAAVERMIKVLRASGELDNTVIVFVSDNGYAWGEHRLQGKNTPYDVSVRVPLVMRYDGVLPPGEVDERAVAANVDVHASILDFAGVKPGKIDGISVLSPAPRDGVVMEAMRWSGWRGRPAYCGFRTSERLYVRYSTGEEELYDYTVDPYELRNVASEPLYAADLEALHERTREACDPTPPGFAWDQRVHRLRPPTNVIATWKDDRKVRVSWRAPSDVGAVLPKYQVFEGRRPYGRPICELESVRLKHGLTCDVTVDRKDKKPAFVVVAVRQGQRAAAPPVRA